MSDWNEQAAPNNNLPAKTLASSKFVLNRQNATKKKSFKHTQANK